MPGSLGFVLAAVPAPGLFQYLSAGLVESARHVFFGLDVARDARPLLPDGADVLGGPEEVVRAGQTLDRETERELPGVSFLHANREPIACTRGEERPPSLGYVLRGGPAVG